MSVNIGAQMVEQVQELRKSEHWVPFLDALHEFTTKQIQASLDTPIESVVAANFYARGWNDFYVALVAATKEVNVRAVVKPGAPPKVLANV